MSAKSGHWNRDSRKVHIPKRKRRRHRRKNGDNGKSENPSAEKQARNFVSEFLRDQPADAKFDISDVRNWCKAHAKNISGTVFSQMVWRLVQEGHIVGRSPRRTNRGRGNA